MAGKVEDKICPYCRNIISHYTVPGGAHITDEDYAKRNTCYRQKCKAEYRSIMKFKNNTRKKIVEFQVVLSPIDLFNSGRWSEI